jgi:tRNA(fMet)-specific endonuclease VapC
MGTLYLLDTNILVRLIRQDSFGQYLNTTYSFLTTDPRPLISVVTDGEIRSLAHQWRWGRQKKEQMRFLVGFFRRAPIDDVVLETYALMDAYSETIGKPMGKNDVWIAAAAFAYDAHLVTTDHDFTHLTPVFITLDLVDPQSSLDL